MEQTDDDFDPYEHRDRPEKTKTKTWQTLMHFLKGSIGTGILAMHMAFKNSGTVVGIISIIFFSIISCGTMQLLIRAQYVLCKKKKVGLLSYSEAMEYAFETGPAKTRKFSKVSFYTVDVFLLIYQIGVCSVYIVFISGNLQQVIMHFTNFYMPLRAYCCIIFIPIILLNLIRTYRYLAPFATFANVCTILGLCFIMYFVLDDLPSFCSKPMSAPIERYPMHVGNVLFALNTIGVITSLENNMLKPGDYIKPFGILNVGFLIIMVLYMSVGLCGYIKYGHKPDMGATITLDIPIDNYFAVSLKILFCAAITVSHAIQNFPAVEIILTKYLNKKMENSNRPVCFEYVVRMVTTLVSLIAAVSIPMLGEIINLLGVFCLSALCFVFPPILDFYARYPNLGKIKWRAICDVFIAIFGLFSFLVGTYSCIVEIVEKIDKSND